MRPMDRVPLAVFGLVPGRAVEQRVEERIGGIASQGYVLREPQSTTDRRGSREYQGRAPRQAQPDCRAVAKSPEHPKKQGDRHEQHRRDTCMRRRAPAR